MSHPYEFARPWPEIGRYSNQGVRTRKIRRRNEDTINLKRLTAQASLSLHIAAMSDEFNVPGGDIILRAQGSTSPHRDFQVHKLILSLASPVFRDMFHLPRPGSDVSIMRGDNGIEVVVVTDPPRALDLVLRFIYPFPPPDVDSLDLLVEGLVIADKYNIEGTRARLRALLINFVDEAPLRVFAIASRFGFDGEAEAASSLTTTTYLPALTELPDDMGYIPVSAYHKLIVLHAEHRDCVEDVVDAILFEPVCMECKMAKALAEPMMRTKLVRIICRGKPMTVASCIKQLGIPCRATCMTKFVESVVRQLGSRNTVIRSSPPQ